MRVAVFDTGSFETTRCVHLLINEEEAAANLDMEALLKEGCVVPVQLSLTSPQKVQDYQGMKDALAGAETVITLMRAPEDWESNQTILAGHHDMIKAMKELEVNQLVIIGTESTVTDVSSEDYMIGAPIVMGQQIVPPGNTLTTITRWAKAFSLDWAFVTMPQLANNKQLRQRLELPGGEVRPH